MYMNKHRYANAGKIRGAGTRQIDVKDKCMLPHTHREFDFLIPRKIVNMKKIEKWVI